MKALSLITLALGNPLDAALVRGAAADERVPAWLARVQLPIQP